MVREIKNERVWKAKLCSGLYINKTTVKGRRKGREGKGGEIT